MLEIHGTPTIRIRTERDRIVHVFNTPEIAEEFKDKCNNLGIRFKVLGSTLEITSNGTKDDKGER